MDKMDKLINREKLGYTTGQLWTKLKTVFAQLNAENVFTKRNTFNGSIMLKHEAMYVSSPVNNDSPTLSGVNKVVGCRKYTSHSNNNNGYVKSVKLKVKEDFGTGSTIRSIKLWAVEKRDSLAQDVILEEIHDVSSVFVVKEEVGFGKYIELFVERKFENPTYFLVGHSHSVSYVKRVAADDDNIYGTLSSVPGVGSSGITSTNNNFLVQYGLVAENMNLAIEIERLDNMATGSVKSINSQKPDDNGNINLNYYHSTNNQISDANEFKTHGIAKTKNTTANLPGTASKWGIIQFLRENDSVGIQLWYSTSGNTNGTIWTRNILGDVWSEWERITTTNDLSGIVRNWDDLDYTVQYPIINLFNPANIIDGQYYEGNGILVYDKNWCRFEIPCKAGDVIRFAKKQHDSGNFMPLDKNGDRLGTIVVTRSDVNGWKLYTLTIPSTLTNVAKVSVNIHKSYNPIDGESIMVFTEQVDPPTNYVPATGGKNVLINSNNVGLLFDNNGTTLASKTVDGAVVELDKKTEKYLKYAEHVGGGNLFNKNKLERGKYVAHVDGSIGNTPGWGVYWSDFGVKPGDKFIVNQTDPTYAYYVWFVHEGGGRFERTNIDSNGMFTVPNNERIVGFVINVKISDGSENTFMLYRGDTMPSTYQPYGGGDYVLFPHQGFKFGFDNGGKTILGNNLQTAVTELAKMVITSIIGELKILAYDAGERFEECGRIWLRCDGQSLPVQNYNEFYKHMRNVFEENMPEFTLPHKPDYGYLYICIE